MTESEAVEVLSDVDLVPVIEGSLAEVKRIARRFLDEDLPVALAPPPGRT